MVVELQRDADHLGAGARGQRGDDAAVDAARHGDDDAGSPPRGGSRSKSMVIAGRALYPKFTLSRLDRRNQRQRQGLVAWRGIEGDFEAAAETSLDMEELLRALRRGRFGGGPGAAGGNRLSSLGKRGLARCRGTSLAAPSRTVPGEVRVNGR